MIKFLFRLSWLCHFFLPLSLPVRMTYTFHHDFSQDTLSNVKNENVAFHASESSYNHGTKKGQQHSLSFMFSISTWYPFCFGLFSLPECKYFYETYPKKGKQARLQEKKRQNVSIRVSCFSNICIMMTWLHVCIYTIYAPSYHVSKI